ncbi:MAG: sugar nucleotide-binding protein [Pseudomonadota bacterium]
MSGNSYLIIGASGYLGSYFLKNILEKTDSNIIATHNSKPSILNDRIKWCKLDITDYAAVNNLCNELGQTNKKFKTIYLSAYHHPDKVEENPRIAWDINAASLDNFLCKAKSYIESLYYASTDSVYGESIDNHVFSESDICNPVNTYGRTKVAAEQVVLMHGFSVVRYSLLMGPSLILKKHFFDVIVESLREGKNIDMFNDSYRSTISFNSASYLTILLLEKYYKKRDIINVSGDLHLSKFDMAVGIAKKLALNDSFIQSKSIVNQDNFGSKRAKSTLMSNEKLKNILKLNNILYDYE